MDDHQQKVIQMSPTTPAEIFATNVLEPIRILTAPQDNGQSAEALWAAIREVIQMEHCFSRGDIALSSKFEMHRFTVLFYIEFLTRHPMSPLIHACAGNQHLLFGHVQALCELGLRICSID